MTRVLCVGECMAELAPAGAVDTYRLGFAGDTFNTAWYLARLGVPVCYLTAVGDDATSRRMRGFMDDAGVGTEHVQTIAGGTAGLYMISLDGGERSFTYWRGQSAARRLADDDAHLARAMDQAGMIYLSGITLAILAPEARTRLFSALREARTVGRAIAFDPNLRPKLWPDADAMTSTVMEAAALADIALPSHEDEAEWFGDADPAATAARYAAAGARTVAVKDGASAVLWRQGDERGTCPVTAVPEVVDSTAAGDSFNAGLLGGLISGSDLPEAVRRGCALAARVVQGAGALVQT